MMAVFWVDLGIFLKWIWPLGDRGGFEITLGTEAL